MSDRDTSAATVQSQIAEAIRAKREGHSKKLVRDELEAMEASLLLDLDNFDPESMARQIDADERKSRASGPVNKNELAYPDINSSANRQIKPDAAIALNTAASSTNQESPKPSGSSLLDQLRQQTEAIQHNQHTEDQQTSKTEVQLDAALRQVFSYLHELAQQLNVLKPPISRSYLIAGSQELRGLAWQHGSTDYRTRAESAGALIEFVSFNYKLLGTQALEMERDGMVAESFRKFLFERNLKVNVEEFRSERHYVEKARFTVAPEVTVNIRWEADARTGKLLVQTRNLERLGSACYQLAPEALNQALLDEFGRLVLNQPQQFSRQVVR